MLYRGDIVKHRLNRMKMIISALPVGLNTIFCKWFDIETREWKEDSFVAEELELFKEYKK